MIFHRVCTEGSVKILKQRHFASGRKEEKGMKKR